MKLYPEGYPLLEWRGEERKKRGGACFYPGGRAGRGGTKRLKFSGRGRGPLTALPPPHLAQIAGPKHKLENFFKFMFGAGDLRERRIVSGLGVVIRRSRGGVRFCGPGPAAPVRINTS